MSDELNDKKEISWIMHSVHGLVTVRERARSEHNEQDRLSAEFALVWQYSRVVRQIRAYFARGMYEQAEALDRARKRVAAVVFPENEYKPLLPQLWEEKRQAEAKAAWFKQEQAEREAWYPAWLVPYILRRHAEGLSLAEMTKKLGYTADKMRRWVRNARVAGEALPPMDEPMDEPWAVPRPPRLPPMEGW